MIKAKSVVLLSAGLDSTVNLYMAMKETEVVQTLTFDYGQKAAKKEIEKSAEISKLLNIPHRVIELPWLKDFGTSSLTSDALKIPTDKQVVIDSHPVSLATARSVWVPNRNGIFLNIAAGLAESLNAHFVVPGFNLEEASTFPDNSYEFVRNMRKSLYLSTANHVDVHCYTITLNKNEIVEKGLTMLVPFKNIWPCYLAGDKWCGRCESCKRAARAFKANRVDVLGCFE